MVGIAAMVLIGGCATPQQVRREPQILPAQSFARQWTAELDLQRDNVEQIHVRPDMVFAYTQRRHSYVLNRGGGHLEGIHILPREMRVRGPVVGSERIVYPTSATLEVFDLRGRRLQTVPLPRAARSGAVGRGAFVYIGLDYPGGGRISAIDVSRPHAHSAWERMTFGGVSATPAVYEDVIYAGSEDGRLYAIQADGDGAWGLPHGSYFVTGDRILGDIAADRMGVYVASTDSKLYSLDRHTGRIQWTYFAGAPLTSGPIVTSDMVYQQAPGQGLVAIDKAEGQMHRTPRWVSRDAVRVLSEDQRHVYVQRRDNRIAALDKQNGEVRWESGRTNFRVFGTNLHDEMIYAATREGEIVAIRPVLRGGTVGELVMEVLSAPLAMAN
jgi:outer membrane protein assembly factor BamB